MRSCISRLAKWKLKLKYCFFHILCALSLCTELKLYKYYHSTQLYQFVAVTMPMTISVCLPSVVVAVCCLVGVANLSLQSGAYSSISSYTLQSSCTDNCVCTPPLRSSCVTRSCAPTLSTLSVSTFFRSKRKMCHTPSSLNCR